MAELQAVRLPGMATTPADLSNCKLPPVTIVVPMYVLAELPASGGVAYIMEPGSPKYNKILAAAVLACMPISPSRAVVGVAAGGGSLSPDAIHALYASLAPSSQSNSRVPQRLDNKLAYSLANTSIEMRFYHSNQEPPLVTYLLPDDPAGFRSNELGWQDQITVTVHYNLALLPGAGRLLAGHIFGTQSGATGSSGVGTGSGAPHQYPLEASISMGNEGEKSEAPYGYSDL